MTLPNVNITPIPDTDPDAVPALWNTRYAEMDENFGYLEGRVNDQENNAAGAEDAVKLDWLLLGQQIRLEQWSSAWRLYDPVSLTVTGAVSGDDSVDVDDTSDLVVGHSYVIFDASHIESVTVSEVLSSTRFTATENLANDFTGATLAGMNWDITNSVANAENNEVCYFLPVNVGDDSGDKAVIIRREDNDCTFRVFFKDADHVTWTECVEETETAVGTGIVDTHYIMPGSGDISVKIVCESGSTSSDVDVHLIGVLNKASYKNVIYDDTTYYLSSTGSDATGNGTVSNPWATVHKALAFLGNKRINDGVTVTIELDDGTYPYMDTIIANHEDGDKIKIAGKNIYAKTISAIVNNTGTEATPALAGNAIQAVLTLDDVDDIEVNDYAIIRNLHVVAEDSAVYNHSRADMVYQRSIKTLQDRGTVLHLNGCFKVTAVDAGASQITVLTTFYTGLSYSALKDSLNQTTGAYSGELIVLKSILSFTNVAGITTTSGRALGSYGLPGIDNLAIIGNDGSNDDNLFWKAGVGIGAIERSQIFVGENVGVADWWIGIGASHTSNIFANKACVSGCWKAGLYASFSSAIMAYNSYVTGCENGGYSHDASAIHMDSSGVACCSHGLRAVYGSHIMMSCGVIENCAFGTRAHYHGSIATLRGRAYNCGVGHSAEHNGFMISSLDILHTCTTGANASLGGIVEAGQCTFTDCDTDSSPAVNTEGNVFGYVKHTAVS